MIADLSRAIASLMVDCRAVRHHGSFSSGTIASTQRHANAAETQAAPYTGKRTPSRPGAMPNRLVHARSLYLRKHADNPIDWWPWCDEAIATARSQNKPIFLSVGYSSCHWCTVMEGEAFSDTMIADFMNAHFVPIKVDREERPDLDSVYMQAVQIMGEHGGWPLNLFLAPDDLLPFYGGTYFPIEPRYGRPGFLKVLQSIHAAYQAKPDELRAYRGQIAEALRQVSQVLPAESLPPQVALDGIAACAPVVDNRGIGTSFPSIPYADLVLRGSRFAEEPLAKYNLAARARQRGLDIALGGIYDHVAGGWHRYTVDPTWTVPHFEKMLYDNGLNLKFLANLWAAGVQEPAIARAAYHTALWLQREMLNARGYFYASQDADSEGKEGKFWVWSYVELKRLFSEAELAALAREFTIAPEGNFEEQNVLQRRRPGELSDTVEACLDRLFQQRYGEHSRRTDAFPPARSQVEAKDLAWPGRVPPVTDTKAIVAWNGLAISGLARCYQVFGADLYRDLALGAATYLLERQWVDRGDGKRLYRLGYDGDPTEIAQAEDYAFLIEAMLDLHQACLDRADKLSDSWLAAAIALQAEFDALCWDDSGGYFNTSSDASDRLIVREKSYQDSATPSANAIAIANAIRLSLLTENLDYLTRAETSLHAFGEALSTRPIASPGLVAALDLFHNATLVRVRPEYLAALQQQYLPVTVLQVSTDLPDDAIGMVCRNFACLPPATEFVTLQQQLAACQTRSAS